MGLHRMSSDLGRISRLITRISLRRGSIAEDWDGVRDNYVDILGIPE